MKTTPLAILGATALVVVLLLLPLPVKGRVTVAVVDLAHAPVFFALALAAHSACRRWLPQNGLLAATTTWLVFTGLGLATEAAQGYVHRGPSFDDALANSLGSMAGVFWAETGRAATVRSIPAVAWLSMRLAIVLLLMGTAVLRPVGTLADAVRQWAAMPQLASFESQRELRRWIGENAQIEIVTSQASEGNASLQIELQPGIYSGAQMNWLPGNWSPYDDLLLDVHLDDGEPLELIVKIHDYEHWEHGRVHHDRFHQHVRLYPGWQQIRVRLADVEAAPRGRKMNLHEICFLQLFTFHPAQVRTLHLDEVRLR